MSLGPAAAKAGFFFGASKTPESDFRWEGRSSWSSAIRVSAG